MHGRTWESAGLLKLESMYEFELGGGLELLIGFESGPLAAKQAEL